MPNGLLNPFVQVAIERALANGDPNDYSNMYNTLLTPEEEARIRTDPRVNVNDTYDYDIRGAWKELVNGTMERSSNGHLGDKYKKPNHMTASNESIYQPELNGKWVDNGDGTNTFIPSMSNIAHHDPIERAMYFMINEPGNKVTDRYSYWKDNQRGLLLNDSNPLVNAYNGLLNLYDIERDSRNIPLMTYGNVARGINALSDAYFLPKGAIKLGAALAHKAGKEAALRLGLLGADQAAGKALEVGGDYLDRR